MRNCKLLILQKPRPNNVLKNVEKCYPKHMLMEDPLHCLTAWSLPGHSLMDFCTSTRFEVYSFQTNFIFEIISSSLSKGVFSLSSYAIVLTLS